MEKMRKMQEMHPNSLDEENLRNIDLSAILLLENEILDLIGNALKIKDLLEELLTAYSSASLFQAWLTMNLYLRYKSLSKGGENCV